MLAMTDRPRTQLHDVIVHVAPPTPGLIIRTGVHTTAFGTACIGVTDRGICHLTVADDHAELAARRARLAADWPGAMLIDDPQATAPHLHAAMDPLQAADRPRSVHLHGTEFQVAVWRALLGIPMGTTVSYRDLAAARGRPTAVRAVGSAVGDNPESYLIPCHRVLRSDGGIGGYAWGIARKSAMLAREGVR